MPRPCSRPSRPARSTCGRRTIRPLGQRLRLPGRHGRARHQGASSTIALPAGMSALVFNTRRPLFADPRVRAAPDPPVRFRVDQPQPLSRLYTAHAELLRALAARLRTAGRRTPRERALLAPFPERRASQPFLDGTYRSRSATARGATATTSRRRFELLAAAGYTLRRQPAGRCEPASSSQFEILAPTRRRSGCWSAMRDASKRLGIDVRVRQVDSAQYQSRLKTFDFDMIQSTWPSSLSPGNEQFFRWSSQGRRNRGHVQLSRRQEPRRRRHDRGAAGSARRPRTSPPPCARSTACCCRATM